MKIRIVKYGIVWLFLASYSHHLISQTLIETDISCVIKEVSYHPVSMNLNYLTDGDDYLASDHSTEVSLKRLNSGFLRYPGGEKSDNYFWSIPPFQNVNPHFAVQGDCNWPNDDSNWSLDFNTPKEYVLDFDEFMTLCQKVQSEPFIVVAADPQHFNDAGCTSYPTLVEVTEVAKEWVRYANITNELNIKYWMVGNESWNSAAYDNGIAAFKYRDDFKVIASAMKNIDSTIKIVANTRAGNYAKKLLEDSVARSLIDYVAISNYPLQNWGNGYTKYRTTTPSFVSKINNLIDDIELYAPNSNIEVIVSEFAAIDWASNGWSNTTNDLGHALVTFQMIGDQLEIRQLHNAFYWNTRWVHEYVGMYNSIDFDGNLNATGTAFSIWGKFLLDKLVSSSETNHIRSFTTRNDKQTEVNVMLINKKLTAESVDVSINRFLDSIQGNAAIKIYEFTGSSVTDEHPIFAQVAKPYTLSGNQISLNLEATSVTVISLKINNPTLIPNACPNNLMVSNSGFESESLIGWESQGNTILSSDAYSGIKALKINGLQSGVERLIEVKHGDSCSVNAFLKQIGGNTAGTFQLRFLDQNGDELSEEFIPINLEEHYAQYDFTAVAPENAKEASIRFFSNGNQGSILVDNVCFMILNEGKSTGIDPFEEKKIIAYPNPVKDILHVKLKANHQYETISLYDLSGSLIIQEKLQQGALNPEINLSSLSSGLYFLSLQAKGEKEVVLIRKE